MGNLSNQQILGIVFVVLGAILLFNFWSIPFLSEAIGICLIVVGILILMGKMAGAQWVAVTVIVVGLLFLVRSVEFVHKIVGAIESILTTVIAVLLIVFGVLKIMRKA